MEGSFQEKKIKCAKEWQRKGPWASCHVQGLHSTEKLWEGLSGLTSASLNYQPLDLEAMEVWEPKFLNCVIGLQLLFQDCCEKKHKIVTANVVSHRQPHSKHVLILTSTLWGRAFPTRLYTVVKQFPLNPNIPSIRRGGLRDLRNKLHTPRFKGPFPQGYRKSRLKALTSQTA